MIPSLDSTPGPGKRSLQVTITENRSAKSTRGIIHTQAWSRKERAARAMKIGAACWGAALVAILIPILHFFLVPMLFVSGPVVAWFVLKQESVVSGGTGVCPNCEALLPIARARYRFPISDTCGNCQSDLKIQPVTSHSPL